MTSSVLPSATSCASCDWVCTAGPGPSVSNPARSPDEGPRGGFFDDEGVVSW